MKLTVLSLALCAAATQCLAEEADPERLCDLDGQPVAECVWFYREAGFAKDAEAKAEFERKALAELEKARAAKRLPVASQVSGYKFPPDGPEAAALPPLDRYRENTSYVLLMCKMAFEAARYGKGDFNGCLKEGATRVRALFDKALPAVKKPAAKQALKDVQVAFSVALAGIAPSLDELKIGYTARQADLQSKITAAWSRFDVEK